jgi:hypothetical protein
MSKKVEMTFGAFERKIIRGMCGQIEENGSYNNDIYGIYNKDIVVVTCTKLGRLEWAGNICRTDGPRTPRKILQ